MIALTLQLFVLGSALVLSYVLTGIVRSYVVRKGIVDVPNVRSSHTNVTPRGGGLAIAAVFLIGTAILGLLGIVPEPFTIAMVGGGLLVAGVGWIDDARGLTAKQRATVHFLAAIWAVSWLGGLPTLHYGPGELGLGLLGSILAVVGIAWMINLYNFMDGIDGLAAGEAVSVALIGGLLLLAGGQSGLGAVAMLVAGTAAGFLIWNWPPAKIFMGDVSSGLLGFIFGTLAVASERIGSVPLLVWVLLLGVFVTDATATLVWRSIQGKKWYQAHRSHAYQLAVIRGYTHKQVTLSIILINAALGCLGWAVWKWPELLPVVVLPGLGSLLLVWRMVHVRYVRWQQRNERFG